MLKMNSKGQTISADAFIAIALFLVVVIFFFSFSGNELSEKKVEDLQGESTKLMSAVSGTRNSTSAFVVGTKVDEDRLASLSALDYDDLRKELGIEADFCIHFEDENGNVVKVSDTKTGLGSSHVLIGGTACG